MQLAPDLLIAGKYRLTRPLARGGMGAVWLGSHEELGIEIALKFLRSPHGDPGALERFRQEARSAARLSSPHIVRVIDFGVTDDAPYLVMERLVGEDLGLTLARRGTLPPGELLDVVEQVARGLTVLHEAGIVHRDIKPANLFLETRTGLVKILDFGIAKQLRGSTDAESPAPRGVATNPSSERAPSNETRALASPASGAIGIPGTGSALFGSPGYMSPEQARGASVEVRSDLYSLAAVAYHALIGTLPPLRNSGSTGLSEPIDAFFARALAEHPSARPGSALELSLALGEALREAGLFDGRSSRTALGSSASMGETLGRTTETAPLDPREGRSTPLPTRLSRPAPEGHDAKPTSHLTSSAKRPGLPWPRLAALLAALAAAVLVAVALRERTRSAGPPPTPVTPAPAHAEEPPRVTAVPPPAGVSASDPSPRQAPPNRAASPSRPKASSGAKPHAEPRPNTSPSATDPVFGLPVRNGDP